MIFVFGRVLLSSKKPNRPPIDKKINQNLNMHIQKSIHTIYSRLANVSLPEVQ